MEANLTLFMRMYLEITLEQDNQQLAYSDFIFWV